MKVAIQICFCKVAGENGKKLLPDICLSYQKRISSMDVFKILQLSATDFLVRIKGAKQKHFKKIKQIRYFNIINIALCWWEIDCTFEGSVINQSWSSHFPVATFSQMALFRSWPTCHISTISEGVFICKCQCFCLFNIQQWSVLS